MTKTGLVVVAHGTVESLDDLPAFLTNIRRGHAPPAELVEEVERRYRAIGGRSPLNAIVRELATKLAVHLGLPAAAAGRLFHPYPAEAIAALAAEGVDRLVVVPLAQHSAPIYVASVREAAPGLEVVGPGNWGQNPELIRAFTKRVDAALDALSERELGATSLVWTAHSLPTAVVAAGDPYETEVRAAARSIEAGLRRRPGRTAIAFQSQGMSKGPGGRPVAWMGPTLEDTMDAEKAAGSTRIVVAPVGFLADHVEILYDLDIEAKARAHTSGLAFSRTESLNADDDFVAALASVVRPFLAPSEARGPR